MKTIQERFETKFKKGEEDKCWNWTANKNREGGYGQFSIAGRRQLAHRIAYQLYVGEIPEGMLICHFCDNPACVNPAHLFPGTQADNMIDCMNKGRVFHPVGEKHGHAKLTGDQVGEIRQMSSEGARNGDLSRLFGVSRPTISNITHGKRWANTIAENH